MGFSKRLRGLIKHGKLNPYDILVAELEKGQDSSTEIEGYLDLLQPGEQQKIVAELWDRLSPLVQSIIAKKIYYEDWEKLTEDFDQLTEKKRIQHLEILGYISRPEMIGFLIKNLQGKRESISLTAMGALKKQNSQYILEPMLLALLEPGQWLPARVIEVLRGIDKKIITKELLRLMESNPQCHYTLVEVLGEIGDEHSLPILASLANTSDPVLRKRVAEALKGLQIAESWTLLVKFLEDEKWPIRMAAVQGLGVLKERLAIPFLVERLAQEEDPLVQEMIKETVALLEEVDEPQIINWVRGR